MGRLLVCLFGLILAVDVVSWGQSSLFLSPLNSEEDRIEAPKSICQDKIGRFWMVSGDRLLLLNDSKFTDYSHYVSGIIESSKCQVFAPADDKIVLISTGDFYSEIDLLQDRFYKKNLAGRLDTFKVIDNQLHLFGSDRKLEVIDLWRESFEPETRTESSILRTATGPVDSDGIWYRAVDIDLYYRRGRLYLLRKEVNAAISQFPIPGEHNYGLRVAFPIDSNRVFISGDSAMALYVFDGKSYTYLPDLPQNKSLLKKYSGSTVFHATAYGKNQLALIDQLGQILLFDWKTLSFSDKLVTNANMLFLKNIFTDSKGNLWIGSYDKEVYVFNPKGKLSRTYTNLDNNYINDIFRFYEDSEGYIWLGMAKGFVLIDPQNQRVYDLQSLTGNTGSGLLKTGVSAIAENLVSGRIWFGTYTSGLFYADKKALLNQLINRIPSEEEVIFSYNKEKGIVQRDIKYINASRNKIFVRSSEGLMIIDTAFSMRTLAVGDGFPTALNNNYNYVLNDRYYFCGDLKAFANIDLLKLENPNPPKSLIPVSEIFLSDNTFKNIYPFALEKNMKVKDDVRYLTLELNKSTPAISNKFSVSIDDGPFQPIRNDEIIFSSPEVGKHRLNVINEQASVFDETGPLILEIEILTSWWKSWWAKLIGVLLATGMVYLIGSSIRRQRRYQQQILALETASLRSQMNPHFISNSLNSINYYILENRMEEASGYIVKFSKLIRRILVNTRQEFISLEEELDALKTYVDMEKLRFKDKFDYQIEVTDGVRLSTSVPSMILQPLVENAIWHGLVQKPEKGSLHIGVKQQDGQLRVVISDDGIGISESRKINMKKLGKSKSFGLEIVRKRLILLNDQYKKNYTLNITELLPDEAYPGTLATLNL